jgi:hypothetical protein
MSFDKDPVIRCPKCGYEANTATALNCTVCTHPLGENIVPVRGTHAVVGKGAISRRNLRKGSSPSPEENTPIEKKTMLLRWVSLALPPLLIGVGYLIGVNSGSSKLSNNMPTPNSIPARRVAPKSIPAPVNKIPASSNKPFVNQSKNPQIPQPQKVETPAKEPLEKPPILVKTEAPTLSNKSVVPLQQGAPQETPLLSSPVKPQVKAKVKPAERAVERPPNQTSQTVEAKEPQPTADSPPAVVIDNSEASDGTPSMDCYGGQSKQSSMCRNRKN